MQLPKAPNHGAVVETAASPRSPRRISCRTVAACLTAASVAPSTENPLRIPLQTPSSAGRFRPGDYFFFPGVAGFTSPDRKASRRPSDHAF